MCVCLSTAVFACVSHVCAHMCTCEVWGNARVSVCTHTLSEWVVGREHM